MANINLLPPDLGPKASYLKAGNLLKKLTTAVLIVFCLGCVGSILYVAYLNMQIKKADTEVSSLKKSVAALENTEQKLFLIRDRLTKINLVKAEAATDRNFEKVAKELLGLDSALSLTTVEADPGKVTYLGRAPTLGTFSTFIGKILADPDYLTISLPVFSYQPEQGYFFELEVNAQTK